MRIEPIHPDTQVENPALRPTQPPAPAVNPVEIPTNPDTTPPVTTPPASATGAGYIGTSIPPTTVLPSMPQGVNVIAGLLLLSALLAFFDMVNVNGFMQLLLILQVVLAFGLLRRMNIARIVMTYFSLIAVVLSIILIFMLARLHVAVHNQNKTFKTTLEQTIHKNSGATDQVEKLRQIDESFDQAIAKIDQQYAKVYVFYGIIIILWDPLESTCRHASLSIL